MHAPAPTSNFTKKEKHPNLQLVPMGTQPAIIYSIVNVGTQNETFEGVAKKVNKLKITLEFPNHKQLFYIDDTVPRPSVLTMQFTYSISKNKKNQKKSNLLQLIESLFGPIAESDYLTFDVSRLLDLKVFANVTHYQKQDKTIGAKVTALGTFNTMMMDPATIIRTNELTIYSIQMGFDNLYFAKLMYFDREQIKESDEGKAHIAAGGRFTKMDENGQMIYEDALNNTVTAPATPIGKMIMTNPDIPYEAWKSQGWTDESLIQHGHARREAPVQVAPIPAPAPIPVAPIPQAPTLPVAPPTSIVPTLTMIDLSFSYEAFITQGWTDDLLVQHGKAVRPLAVAPIPQVPPVPQAPPVPVAPLAPQAPSAPLQPSNMFVQTPVAPVQNTIPVAPIAPSVSTFEQAPTPLAFSEQDEHDDLPF
jgi:hypothetical protein